ncbi:MAG: U32 family peptidase [Synechococcaceae bacterium WBB_10_009]|nr:U32 family peptidase [Synechococcaceae bacterium WBB_10_009]
MPHLPELLAPAGCWQSLRAAVANGADAVYFGVERFNARLRAENFQRADLPEVMAWLHRRGVKGFLTANVLVFSHELSEAAELLLAAAAAGVDAVIVQDIGLAVLAAQLTPSLAVHGSTQMSITSAAGVAMAADLGARRVVLARELSLRDLERLQNQLQCRGVAMPLEVFVHGALCVAYSGQCLTSEALGQRSANRGECAQACRLPYQLVVDGEPRDLHDQRYLLSPQDLAAWELLPQLRQAGVASLKIEGRLKDASYVAAVTQAYRRGLDALAPGGEAVAEPERTGLRRQLELSFSRGLGTGWLGGVNHRGLVHGRWSKKRGPLLGQVLRLEPNGVLVLRTDQPLKAGDGVVLERPGAGPLEPPEEVGGRLMRVDPRPGGCLAVTLGPGRLDLRGLAPGCPCWLSSDPQLEGRLQRLAERTVAERSRPLSLRVRGRVGAPLTVEVIGADGLMGGPWGVESELPLQRAQGQGLDAPRLRQQLGRLGGTPWHLDQLECQLEGPLFLPVAQLNVLRRALVEQLATALERPAALPPTAPPPRGPAQAEAVLRRLLLQARTGQDPAQDPAPDGAPQLTVLARSLEQLEALRDQPVHRVIADLEHPAQLRQAVALGRGVWPGGLWLAGPRITRPDEAWTLEPLLRAAPDGYLVRNADQLERLTPVAPCQGDFSLNVANPLTAHWLMARWGLQRLTASYDLAFEQLLDLVAGCAPGSLEITLHQHMPLFHMEHCLFCAFLSDGHDHTDCGRPCEQHTVLLRDRSGVDHPLRADLGCRNTLFNGRAQTAAEALPALLAAGVRHLRIELLDDTPADVCRRVQLYGQALAGTISGREVWQREQLDSRLGVTRGTLLERR